MSNSRNSEPSVLNHDIFYRSPISGLAGVVCIRIRNQLQSNVSLKSNAKSLVKKTYSKKPTVVFQCISLGELVYLATALTAFAMSGRVWLASHIKRPTVRGKASLFETFLERVCPARTNAYTTINRKPRKNISYPAISHYISELTRQLFDAGIARTQPRVFFCFRVPIHQSANASLHVTRLSYRGSSYSACSFPEGRHVVPQCCKSVSSRCYLISYRDKEITIL